MKRQFLVGLMAATLLPASLLAQTSAAQRVLITDDERKSETVAMTEMAPPADLQGLAVLTANSMASPDSTAAAAMNVTVRASGGLLAGDSERGTPGVKSDGSLASNGMPVPGTDISTGGALERIPGVYRWRHNTGPLRDWLRLYEPQVFQAGVVSVEYGTQYWRSPIYVQSVHETFMLPQIVRIGYQLNDPRTSRFERLKGSFEVLGEVDAIPILGGPGKGTSMIGGSGLFRYHVTLNHRIVPYFQVGFGGLYAPSSQFANAPTDTGFNFITQIAAGSHLFLNDKWAIMMETSYVLINNFGIGTGPGYNVLGGLIGITHYFGGRECN